MLLFSFNRFLQRVKNDERADGATWEYELGENALDEITLNRIQNFISSTMMSGVHNVGAVELDD